MTTWTLIKKQTCYLRKVTKLPDYWYNGVKHAGEETVEWEPILCHYEPFNPEEVELLPNGVKSLQAKWLFTDYSFKTWDDAQTNNTTADKVSFENPETSGTRKPKIYEVWRKEEWTDIESFELLDTTEYDYVVVEEGRLK